MTNFLESAALRTQEAAGRAWADLMNCDASQKAEMQLNYDMAHAAEMIAYNAFKAANDAARVAA